MLYDEPTTGLDPIAVSTVQTLMRETNDVLGLTSLVVTHNVAQVRKLADYCFILSEARIAGQRARREQHLNQLEADTPIGQFLIEAIRDGGL